MNEERYFLQTAAAFVRGRRQQADAVTLTAAQATTPLDQLTPAELTAIFQAGEASGLKLHKFKRTMSLARVKRVLGVLQGLAPRNLLDVGSGRGAFLWPLLSQFPSLTVTAIDQDAQRSSDLQAVHLGGIAQLTAARADVTDLPFEDDAFDVVTMLEVLEHIPAASQAIREAVRVADRFVVLSVPSKPDDNPQHIHLFDEAKITNLFHDTGVTRLTFDYVLNHMLVVASSGR